MKDATTAWLQYENKADEAAHDSMLLHLAFENLDSPEQPEALAILRESRILGIPYFEGGIADLPYIFRLEMRTVIEAEHDYSDLQSLLDSLKATPDEQSIQQR